MARPSVLYYIVAQFFEIARENLRMLAYLCKITGGKRTDTGKRGICVNGTLGKGKGCKKVSRIFRSRRVGAQECGGGCERKKQGNAGVQILHSCALFLRKNTGCKKSFSSFFLAVQRVFYSPVLTLVHFLRLRREPDRFVPAAVGSVSHSHFLPCRTGSIERLMTAWGSGSPMRARSR